MTNAPQSHDAGHEANETVDELILTRSFPSTKGARKEAERFFRESLSAYYRKNNKDKAKSRTEVSRIELYRLQAGFTEVFSNALFHGNLGRHEEKVNDLTEKPENDPMWRADMQVHVVLTLRPDGLDVSVTDEGKEKFDLSQIIARIRKIKELDWDTLIDMHRRAHMLIREGQYGTPIRVKTHRDAQGNKSGTTVTLSRDFTKPLPVDIEQEIALEDYFIVEA